jgi:hypothetical protein
MPRISNDQTACEPRLFSRNVTSASVSVVELPREESVPPPAKQTIRVSAALLSRKKHPLGTILSENCLPELSALFTTFSNESRLTSSQISLPLLDSILKPEKSVGCAFRSPISSYPAVASPDAPLSLVCSPISAMFLGHPATFAARGENTAAELMI